MIRFGEAFSCLRCADHDLDERKAFHHEMIYRECFFFLREMLIQKILPYQARKINIRPEWLLWPIFMIYAERLNCFIVYLFMLVFFSAIKHSMTNISDDDLFVYLRVSTRDKLALLRSQKYILEMQLQNRKQLIKINCISTTPKKKQLSQLIKADEVEN